MTTELLLFAIALAQFALAVTQILIVWKLLR